MARQVEYSDETIIAAGQKILASGGRVTGWRLREEIKGGKASRLAAVWEAHLAAGPAAPKQDRKLSPLPERIAESAAGMRSHLCARLDELVLEHHQVVEQVLGGQYRDEIEKARAARVAFEEDSARAESAVEAAEAERDQQRDLLAAEQLKAAEATRRIAGLEAKLAEVQEQSRRDAAEASRQIADFNDQIRRLGEQLTSSGKEAAAAKATAEAAEKEAERMRDQAAKADAARLSAETSAAKARAEADAANDTASRLQQELNRSREEASRHAEKLAADAASAASRAAAAEAKAAEAGDRAAAAEVKTAEAVSRAAAAEAKAAEARERATAAEARADAADARAKRAEKATSKAGGAV